METPQQRRKEELRQIFREYGIDWLLVIAMMSFGSFGGHAIKDYSSRLYATVIRVVGFYGTQFAIGAVVVALGGFAHWFKGKGQRWYGMVEIPFGTLSAFAIAFNLPRNHISLTQYASLIGSGYVVARVTRHF